MKREPRRARRQVSPCGGPEPPVRNLHLVTQCIDAASSRYRHTSLALQSGRRVPATPPTAQRSRPGSVRLLAALLFRPVAPTRYVAGNPMHAFPRVRVAIVAIVPVNPHESRSMPSRLLIGDATPIVDARMLGQRRLLGLLKSRGRARTDSTHILAAIRTLNRLMNADTRDCR